MNARAGKIFLVVRHAVLIAVGAVSGADAGAAAPPQLAIELRVNGHAAAAQPLQLWRGEPILAEVRLRHSDPAATEALVSTPPGDASWPMRVTIECIDVSSGAAAPMAFAVTGRVANHALTLQPHAVTTLVLRWTGTGDATAAAPRAGEYRLTARLDLADAREWRGIVTSAPLAIAIVEPPVSPTPDELARRQLLRLQDAVLASDLPRAAAIADELLNTDRGRPDGWFARALVAEARGEALLALGYIDTAIARAAGLGADDTSAADQPEPSPKNIPFEYLDTRRRIEGRVPLP